MPEKYHEILLVLCIARKVLHPIISSAGTCWETHSRVFRFWESFPSFSTCFENRLLPSILFHTDVHVVGSHIGF